MATWINNAVVDELLPPRKKTPQESFSIPDAHEDLLFTAHMAEQTERFDDMALCMKKIVKINAELNAEERNLLVTAYKNLVNNRRASWRVIASIEGKENERGSSDTLPLIAMLRRQFVAEIAAICDDIVGLVDSFLFPAAQTGESKVF